MMHMRRTIFASVLCLLLILVLCSCDMQGLVGDLMDEQTEAQTIGLGGLGGFAGAMEIIGTDENGNYILNSENGTVILDGDYMFAEGVDGSYSVIIGGNGSFNYEISLADPLAEVDAYEADAFVPVDKQTDYVKITVRDFGDVVIRLHPQYARATVENFQKLVEQDFYDGLVFHRIIQNFMIQGGGYDESGELHKADAIKGEFDANGIKNPLKHVRGVVSMARTQEVDSASSQFFICDVDNPHLDGQYAAFGVVVAGMEVVDAIAAVETQAGDAPVSPVVIESVTFVYREKQ